MKNENTQQTITNTSEYTVRKTTFLISSITKTEPQETPKTKLETATEKLCRIIGNLET